MRELYYGGWVAPNIYFMGYSSVINFRGLRIAGMSGIYNGRNYRRSYDEKLPYNQNDIRSVYHTRELEVMKLCQIKEKVDIFLSHDWPKGIETYGDTANLLRRKRHFERDVRCVGSLSLSNPTITHSPEPTHTNTQRRYAPEISVV